MRDLFFAGFLAAMMLLAFRRPFLFVLVYAYVDLVAPQRLSYFLLNAIPVSLIVFAFAFLGWWVADDKRDSRFSLQQAIMGLLLVYCFYTTLNADFPIDALEKWDWVWKALVFAIFLPFTLRTKLRIEALAVVMVLCAASIIITGGIKTLASGGGYGSLVLLVDNNSGLYEGSTISAVAIAIIPLILYLSQYGTIFPGDWKVKGFCYALCFACLLIPIGTQTRTGLICIFVMGALMLRFNRYRFVYAGLAVFAGLMAIPFLPQSFTERMSTIREYKSEQSASTRVAVWAWTWQYAKDNPLGGGFVAYKQNKLKVELTETDESEGNTDIETIEVEEEGRAYHSSYFEMLGEQGFPGLFLWLLLHVGAVIRMEILRRRYMRRNREDEQWVVPLATALQNGQIIYLIGSLFIAIAFQPFIYMLIGMQTGLETYCARRRKEAAWSPIRKRAGLGRAGEAAPAGQG